MFSKIPISILKQVTLLKSPQSPHNVYLIGTNHISKSSADNVRELIVAVKPDVVFFELCHDREHFLQPSAWEVADPIPALEKLQGVWSGKINAFSQLGAQSQDNASIRQGTSVGNEFSAGFEAAVSCGAKICLGDRDQDITQRRLWNGLTTYEKFSHTLQQRFPSLSGPVTSRSDDAYENCEENGILDAMLDIGHEFPWIIECTIFERDLYMLYMLKGLLKSLDQTKEGNVVAIVGKAHIPGIVQRWDNETKYPGSELNMKGMEDILRVPSNKDNQDHISVRDLR